MDLAKEIERQQKELREKLMLLENNNLGRLLEEKKQLQQKIAEIDSSVSRLCKELGIETPKSDEEPKQKRSRMSGDVIRDRILAVLKENPQGLSQIDITEKTGVSYPSVINFIKENAANLRSEGERKSKRIFLKH